MLAVVQVVVTSWSKEYRGGTKARVRNQVREADKIPLPPAGTEEPAYLVHTIRHCFGNFPWIGRLPGPMLRFQPVNEPFHVGCVWCRWEGEHLHVDYHWTSEAGMPERHTRQDVLSLRPGEWGRVRYNARISAYHTIAGYDYNDWWYEKWAFNIGLFSTLHRRVFVDSEPVRVHSQMDLLR